MAAAAERLLIARYLWPGPGGRLALLVGAIGCAGVAIGVAALLLVVAFMNGVDARMSLQIANTDGHLSITRPGARLADWHRIQRLAAQTTGVRTAIPALTSPGMTTVGGRVEPVELQGLRQTDLAASPVFAAGGLLVAGSAPRPGQVAVGVRLARQLGLLVGDQLALATVHHASDGTLSVENTGFTLAGIVRTDVEAFDSHRVVMPIEDLRLLLRAGDVASRIDVMLADPDRAPAAAAQLRSALGGRLLVRTWRQLNPTLFAALAQERLAMALAVSLVTVIALFNILSSMVLLVRFKTREIAILRTMGLGAAAIARVFVATGTAIGGAGAVAGLGLALALSRIKDPLVALIRARMASPPHELDVLLDIPLAITPGEVAAILGAVTAGVLASSLYPAIKAAGIDPATALRH